MNSFVILQALIFEPKKAFAELAQRPRVLFPLVLLLVGTCGLVFWYYQVADMAWVTDRQLRTSSFTSQMSDQEITAAAKAASQRPGVSGAIASIVTGLVLVLVFALYALYYSLAAKVTNVQKGFRHWFAFTCWTTLPSLLTSITGAVVLLTATNMQIAESDLRVLSLNSLLFHKAPEDPGYTLVAYMGLPELLTLLLATVGVRQWSGRSWTFSAIFILLPLALIGGVVAMFTMGRS